MVVSWYDVSQSVIANLKKVWNIAVNSRLSEWRWHQKWLELLSSVVNGDDTERKTEEEDKEPSTEKPSWTKISSALDTLSLSLCNPVRK